MSFVIVFSLVPKPSMQYCKRQKELVSHFYYSPTTSRVHGVTMSWRITFVKRSLPAFRNWKKSSLRREDLCRRTNSEWRWSESRAQTYTPRGLCASHSKNILRGFHTSASLDQLVVLKLHLPQSIQSVKTETLQDLLAAISNVRTCNI